MTSQTQSEEVGKAIGFLKVLRAEFVEWDDMMTLQLRTIFGSFAARLASKIVSFAGGFALLAPIASVVWNAVAGAFGVADGGCEALVTAKLSVSISLFARNCKAVVASLACQLNRGEAANFVATFPRAVNLPIGHGWARLRKYLEGIVTSRKRTNPGDSGFDAGGIHASEGTKAVWVFTMSLERGLAILANLVHGSFLWELPYLCWGNRTVRIAAGSGATLVP